MDMRKYVDAIFSVDANFVCWNDWHSLVTKPVSQNELLRLTSIDFGIICTLPEI